jgi:hypothetical protein
MSRAPKNPVPPLPSSLIPVRCRCDSQLVTTDDDGVVWCLRCGRKKVAK